MRDKLRHALDRLPVWLVLLLPLLGVASAVYVYLGVEEHRDYVECKARYDQAAALAADARDRAAESDRDTDRLEFQATTDLIADVVAAAGDDAATAEIVAHWQADQANVAARRAVTAEQRARNPLPQPPADVCGEP